jgi:hypothetical protein
MYFREDDTPYYVGKGKGNRAYKDNGRIFSPPVEDRIKIVLTNLTEEQAFTNERDFIAWYGRKDNNTGILRNLTDGGEGMSGYKHKPETLEGFSLRWSGDNNPSKRPEIKKKQSEYASARLGDKNPFYGKKHSEETKRKISINNPAKRPEIRDKMRQSQLGKKYITNGIVNKVIRKGEELVIPDGWRLGMTKTI